MKMPALLPPQAAAGSRSAVNTQTLSGAPLLSCLTSQAASLGTFPGKGLRVKDSVTSSVSSRANGIASNVCGSLGISNISGSYGTSVPDPGGMAGPRKDSESLSPFPSLEEAPPSPMMGAELQECQSLWVKIELSLLSRVPCSGDRPRGAATDRGGGVGGGGASEGRDRVAAQREREKEWQGSKEPGKPVQAERAEVEEGERAGEREERERMVVLLGDRERPVNRDKVLEGASGQEQNQQRSNGKHRRQAAVGGGTPAERHISKRKNKVEDQHHHQHSV